MPKKVKPVVEEKPKGELCPRCEGSGLVGVGPHDEEGECPVCKGKGFVDVVVVLSAELAEESPEVSEPEAEAVVVPSAETSEELAEESPEEE